MSRVTGVDLFVRKCQETRTAIPAATRVGIFRAAAKEKAAILGAARVRGWNPKGWVGYNVFGTGERTFAVVSLRGARAYWAERGTQPHAITGKGKPLIIKGAVEDGKPVIRWSVKVKGAKPRPFWHQGVAAAAPLVEKEVAAAVGGALGKVFGGR